MHLIEKLLIHLINRKTQPSNATPSPQATGTEILLPAGHVLVRHERAIKEGRVGKSLPSRPVVLTAKDRGRHIWAIGSSGCGKTSLMTRCIASDVACGRSFVSIDLRGDISDKILALIAGQIPAEEIGKRLLWIDLRDDRFIVPFNPLAGTDDVHSRAFLILEAIRKNWESSWGPVIETGLRSSLVALAQCGLSLGEIVALYRNDVLREQVIQQTDAHTRNYWEEYGKLSVEQRRQVANPVLNKLEAWTSFPLLRLMLSQTETLSFRSLFEETPGLMVVVSLAGNRYHGVSRLVGTLLLTCLQSELLHPDRVKEDAPPVTLYLDEFQNLLASAEQLEMFVAEGRRYHTHLFLANQVLAQTPTALREILRGNVYSQFFYQCGPDSKELAGEVHLPESVLNRDDIRQLLSQQRVGQAFLVRRGERSLPVQNLPEPALISQTKEAQMEAVKAVALRAYARPKAVVEQELQKREAQFLKNAEIPADTNIDHKETNPYEIRRGIEPGQPEVRRRKPKQEK